MLRFNQFLSFCSKNKSFPLFLVKLFQSGAPLLGMAKSLYYIYISTILRSFCRIGYHSKHQHAACYFFADVDECQDHTHNCHVNAQCNNTIGSFNCTCLQGYSGDGVNCSGMIYVNGIILNCVHSLKAMTSVYVVANEQSFRGT